MSTHVEALCTLATLHGWEGPGDLLRVVWRRQGLLQGGRLVSRLAKLLLGEGRQRSSLYRHRRLGHLRQVSTALTANWGFWRETHGCPFLVQVIGNRCGRLKEVHPG